MKKKVIILSIIAAIVCVAVITCIRVQRDTEEAVIRNEVWAATHHIPRSYYGMRICMANHNKEPYNQIPNIETVLYGYVAFGYDMDLTKCESEGLPVTESRIYKDLVRAALKDNPKWLEYYQKHQDEFN